MMDLPKSGVVEFDAGACTGCGTCELMCSLYHEGVGGPSSARSRLERDPFQAEFSVHSCGQCDSPECYEACPLQDEALCVCPETGARYIDGDACTGCGECIDACRFEPSRVRLNTERDIAFKCDLCRGRAVGPICVSYCPTGALRFISRSERE
jgi:Fe-S-cluster-containing hydrogenase component 2